MPATANPPTTKPAATKPPPIAMTPEELEQKREEFSNRMFGNSGGTMKLAKDSKKKDVAPDEVAPEVTPEVKAADDVGEEGVAKPEGDENGNGKAEGFAGVDQEMINRVAQAAAEKTADAIRGAESPVAKSETPPPPPPEAVPELSDEQQEIISVLAHLGTDNPEYKGIEASYREFWKLEDVYTANWEKENPGQEFDPESSEHESFYEKNEPVVDDKDFHRAEVKMIRKIADDDAEKKVNSKLAKLEFDRQFEKDTKSVIVAAGSEIVSFLKQASPELAKAIEKDGNILLNPESVKKMEETDPIAFEVLDGEVEKLRHLHVEWDRMNKYSRDQYPVNPEMAVTLSSGLEFRPHAELIEFNRYLENQFASMPESESTRAGKKFMKISEFNERLEKLSALAPAQRSSAIRDFENRNWTLAPEDLKASMTAHYAEIASSKVKKLSDLLDKRAAKIANAGKPNETHAPNSTTTTPPPPPPPLTQPRKSYSPPSTSFSSDKTNTGEPASAASKLDSETIENKMWGR